jgi:hypothetical protein
MQLVRAKQMWHEVLWGVFLAYILVCFALVLYPPFQIACALALGSFIAGYLLQSLPKLQRNKLLRKLGIMAGTCLVAGVLALLFFHTRASVISTITNTAYPGKRIVASGGFDPAHTFSGHLGFDFQFASKAQQYVIDHRELLNQSEASNFILLLPFLALPALYIIYRDYRLKRPADWPLITVHLGFLFFMAWLFVPHLDFIGKALLLDKVPLLRLLLGLGLLNTFQLVLVIRRLPDLKGKLFSQPFVIAYALAILVIEFLLGKFAMERSPGFISIHMVMLLALPVPVIVYALLRKHVTLAVLGFLAFSFVTTAGTNPLYHGTNILTKTPLSQAIKDVNGQNKDNGYWVTEISYLENFPIFNDAPSLSGVYAYPQLSLWKSADNGGQQDIYNRYAHVNFAFDRDPATQVKTELALIGGDHFNVNTEACSAYMRQLHVKYILTTVAIDGSCLQLVKSIPYPTQTFVIYKVN